MKLELIVSSLFLSACGATPAVTSQTTIYGGKPSETGAWPSVVAFGEKDKADGEYIDGKIYHICTGTLIHPRLVVTAAHCVQMDVDANQHPHPGDPEDALVRRFAVHTGNGSRDGNGEMAADNEIEVLDYKPGFIPTEMNATNDAAFLLLKKPIDDIPIIPVLSASEALSVLKVGTSTTMVGFGWTENDELGVKREVEATINSVDTGEIEAGGLGKATCHGDSGGPAFIQLETGEWRVYGITSYGVESRDCGAATRFGIIANSLCWMQRRTGLDLGQVGPDCVPPSQHNDSTPESSFLARKLPHILISNPTGT